ncbi:LOW QUALITY PROTEIN: hypothetical protein QTO34_000837 [Cnephaeus nilssonii]|uniref:Uncharacterized protein n=1 Tax=Cnephaeus nilssonii TaxID=3371016 RepID=A0AA40ID58_CNENI|nr:LOW QUALITY PROTEIN: hypothetical protein QTO34_000837 [Eptesicus nilssonii]
MLPLTAAFEATAQMFSTNSFNEQEAKRTLVGLVRDLRGIAFTFNAKTSFMMLFHGQLSYGTVIQPVPYLWLKLMAEFVHNKSQQLPCDVSFPSGILLFRETSKMITMYGNCMLTLGEVSKDQVYTLKLKGIPICFSMLKVTLSRNNVNFGIFYLYGDNALDNALQTFIKLLHSIPQGVLLDYPKLSQSYYSLQKVLTQDHNFIASLEPHIIMLLHHIMTYLFKQLLHSNRKTTMPLHQESDYILHIMQQHAEMIQQMQSTVMSIIIFKDCRNQWSMYHPLLGLILLDENYVSDLRNSSGTASLQRSYASVFRKRDGRHRAKSSNGKHRQNRPGLSASHQEVITSMKNSTYGVNSNTTMS